MNTQRKAILTFILLSDSIDRKRKNQSQAHGGEVTVNSKEARADDPVGLEEGSEFIIQLPLK